MVDRLVARGLVERSADLTDGRGVRLALTDAGRARQRQVGRLHARSVARAITAELSADEVGQLAAICRKLAGHPVTEDTDKEDSRR
jgi:DNA-binding MarR family transcriptional regulator